MTQTTQESYYESLGRQTGYPFQDKSLPYSEVEPDLTKAVNDNISAEIEDTAQFFSDNATRFRETRQAADGRWRDLANLTRDGRAIIKTFQDYNDEYKNLQKLKELNRNKAWKTNFDAEGISLEEATGRNLVDLNKELGTVEAAIEEKGYYDTVDENEQPIRIYNSDYEDFSKVVTGYNVTNGRGTAAEAERHYDEWIRVAKRSLVHAETGLFWNDLSYSQKLEWKESADALYVQMWRQRDPNLSDRLIINKLLPKFDNKDATLFSGQQNISSAANKYVLGENSKMQGWNIIRSMSNSMTTNNSYSSGDNVIADEMWGKGGWYQRRLAYHEGRLGDKKAARNAANQDLSNLLTEGINSGLINEEHLDNVFTEWQYGKSDGSGFTTFANMNNDSAKILQNAINTLKDKQTTDDLVVAQTRLNSFVDGLPRGKFMSQDDLNFFAAYPTLLDKASKIYQLGQEGGINNPDFATSNSSLQEAFKGRAGDTNHFPNIPPLDKDKTSTTRDAIINNNYQFLKGRGTRYFLEQVTALEKNLNDPQQVNDEALRRTIEALNNGEFDNAVNNAIGDVQHEDPKEVLIRNRSLIDKDPQAWLTSKGLHFGESIYLYQGKDMLEFGGPAPAFYREFEKLYGNMDIKNVIYERLVANEMINPADPKFAPYKLRLSEKKNILDSRLLTYFPSKSKALRFSIVNSANWQESFKDIENENAMKVFDGTGAFRGEDGNYSEDIDLRTLPIFTGGIDPGEGEAESIYQLAFQNPDAEFGRYRMKGRQLLSLLEYMQGNNLLRTEGQEFNDKFEKALVFMTLKLDANKKLSYSGDTSYLDLFELSEDDQAMFDKLVGTGGENIPDKFDNLNFLIKVVVREKINTQL